MRRPGPAHLKLHQVAGHDLPEMKCAASPGGTEIHCIAGHFAVNITLHVADPDQTARLRLAHRFGISAAVLAPWGEEEGCRRYRALTRPKGCPARNELRHGTHKGVDASANPHVRCGREGDRLLRLTHAIL